jgi:protein TonB
VKVAWKRSMADEEDKTLKGWLPALALVAAIHLAAWWAFTHHRTEEVAPRPLQVVQVSLVAPAAPAQPKVTPLQPEQPKPEHPRPEPRPLPVTKAAPVAKPVTEPVAEASQDARPMPAAAPANPPPAAASQAAAEPALELPRYNAAYLSNPPPAYPLAARRRGIEGTVLVRAEVSAGGDCLRTELRKTSGHDMLDQAALEAVRKWRFAPARRGSQAVVAWVEIPISFKLENQ